MASSLPSPTGRGGAVVIASEGGSSSSGVGGGGRRGTPDRGGAHGGSLNHSSHALTQTVQKRRSAMTRCMTIFAASLIVFELLRHLVFVGGKFCGELPRGAPVAVLLAGSAHAFNRTHCGLANRVIAPFTRLGPPVVVFAADENGETLPAGENGTLYARHKRIEGVFAYHGDPEKTAAAYLAPTTHLDPFLKGLLSPVDAVYFLSFTLFFLFLSVRLIEYRKWR